MLEPGGPREEEPLAPDALPPGRWLSEALVLAEIRRPEMLLLLPVIEQAQERYPGARSEAAFIWLAEDGSVHLPHPADRGEVTTLDWIRNHPSIGSQVGPYTLVDLLGEGGFAEVYRVAREAPVQREAALKILKLGMDSHELLARFAREREALAKLEHSGIARVYDAGNTDAGRPYVVMELVRGLAITEYCDENKLTVRGRAELFCGVCRAIAYAHSKGVIHRDIKPSNVLVHEEDGVPKPKVIDFGIAHAASEAFTGQTVYTRTHQFFGTPGYVPPEQFAGGADPDERADVYALGAVLYELLTGRPPHAAALADAAGIEEILAALRTPVPSPPVAKRIDRPIARVALRALEPRPQDRYQTANELLEDLQLALAGRPPAIRVASQRRRFAKRGFQLALAAAALYVLTWFVVTTLTLLGFYHKTPISRAPDGTVRPVALYQFDGDLQNSIPGSPPLTLHGDPAIDFKSATIGGQTAQVIEIPQLGGDQWFSLPNIIGPNGDRGSDQTNHFTFVFDLMLPAIGGRIGLFQCHTENLGDAEVHLTAHGFGNRDGSPVAFHPGDWYRIAIVSTSVGNVQSHQYYINGTPWGSATVAAMTNGKHALDERIQFFCDGKGRTARMFVNSLAIYDLPLEAHEISALGSISGSGIPETAYPSTPRPAASDTLAPFQKLYPPTAQPDARFGTAIASHPHQGEIAIYSPLHTASFAGGLTIWIRDINTRTFQNTQSMTSPASQPWEAFGTAAAYHADTLAIGAPGDRTHGLHSGAVYFAIKENGRWKIDGKTTPTDNAAGARFGEHIASSAHGIFISAPQAEEPPGAVYYYRNGERTTAAQKILPPTDCTGQFGTSIAASGAWLAISSPHQSLPGKTALYHQDHHLQWKCTTTLQQPQGLREFGHHIATDGTTLAISATTQKNSAPRLVVYTLPKTPDEKIPAPQILHPRWSHPATIDALTLADGILAAGSRQATTGAGRKGSVATFRRTTSPGSPGTFTPVRHYSPATLSEGARLGTALALLPATRQHPATLIAGAPAESTTQLGGGAALAFTIPTPEDQRFPAIQPHPAGILPAISGDIAAISAVSFDYDASPGTLTLYRRHPGSRTWTQTRQRDLPTNNGLLHTGSALTLGSRTGAVMTVPELMLFDLAGEPGKEIPLTPLRGNFANVLNPIAISGKIFAIPNTIGIDFFQRHPKEGWLPLGKRLEKAHQPSSFSLHGTQAITPTTAIGGTLSVIQLHPGTSEGWEYTATIAPPEDTPAPLFGHSISHRQSTLAVGSPGTSHRTGTNLPATAAVYLYEIDQAGTWQPTTRLTAPEQSPQVAFGTTIALADETTLLIGNPTPTQTRTSGKAYLYKKSKHGHWHHRATLQATNATPGDQFGSRITANPHTAIITGNLPHTYFYDLTQFTP